MASRDERKVLSRISAKGLLALEILRASEKAEFEVTDLFGDALEEMPITFVVFACLGTIKGKEELRLDLLETIFLKKFKREAEKLFRTFAEKGVDAQLRILLPDLEPRRTWGWKTPQEEITGLCEAMIEDAAASLPQGWRAQTWSSLEAQTSNAEAGFRDACASALKAHPQLLRDETLFFEELRNRHPDILLQGKPADVAVRQIAAYAHEGCVLETVWLKAILLQTDTPVCRKDKMFQALRSAVLPIVHPFTR